MASELSVHLGRLGAESPAEVRDGFVQLLGVLKRAQKEDVVQASVSEHVAAAMESHSTSSEVQRWAAAVLQEMFQRFEMVGQKDLALLLHAAAAHASSLDVQRWCFSALLCALEIDGADETSDSTVIACTLLQEGVLDVLASAFRAHDSPSLLERVASLLAALVLEGGSDAADEATTTGCLASTLGTLQLTVGKADSEEASALVEDVPLQLACLRVLWAVCESNEELGATEIAAKDGLDIVVSILQQNGLASESPEIRKWSASVLQVLFAHGGELVVETAVQLEVAEALVMTLACSLNDLEVVERCAAALATMSGFSDEAGLAVAEAGGLGAVEEAVGRYGSERDLAQWYLALQQSLESHGSPGSSPGAPGTRGPGLIAPNAPSSEVPEAPEVEIEF